MPTYKGKKYDYTPAGKAKMRKDKAKDAAKKPKKR